MLAELNALKGEFKSALAVCVCVCVCVCMRAHMCVLYEPEHVLVMF